MIKNFTVITQNGYKVNKPLIHKIAGNLKTVLNVSIESLNVNFLSADSIKEINIRYLGHDYSTDIITFNYSGDNTKFDGEIFISVADACENSHKYNCSLDTELLRLIIHGILHLAGYDDHLKADKIRMKKKENSLVSDLAFLIKGNILIYDSKNS
ncbi:MAG: rRNA maturation RNase YbeY [Ignavibacteria bacterium]